MNAFKISTAKIRVYICIEINVLTMDIFCVILFFLISLVLMPFFTHGEPWIVKLFYLALCVCFTPIIGIPIYRHFAK